MKRATRNIILWRHQGWPGLSKDLIVHNPFQHFVDSRASSLRCLRCHVFSSNSSRFDRHGDDERPVYRHSFDDRKKTQLVHSKSQLSPESEVEWWTSLTERLLRDVSATTISSQRKHELEQCLSWWTRQRPIKSVNVQVAWSLYCALDNKAETKHLHQVLDCWRLAFRESSSSPRDLVLTPWQAVHWIQENHHAAGLTTARTYALIVSAMANDGTTTPSHQLQKLHRDIVTRFGPEPRTSEHAVIWNSLMTAYIKHVNAATALARCQTLFADLSRNDLTTPISQACLLQALSRAGLPLQAEQAWNDACQCAKTSSQGFLHVLTAWCNAKSQQSIGPVSISDGAGLVSATTLTGVDRAVYLLDHEVKKQQSETRHATVDLNTRHFSVVMAALARAGRTQQVEDFLGTLQCLYETTGNDRLRPTTFVFNSVLHAYAINRPHEAQELLHRLTDLAMRTQNDALLPDLTSFHTVLHGWTTAATSAGTGGDQDWQCLCLQKADNVLAGILTEHARLAPTVESFLPLIKAWSKSTSFSAAERCEDLIMSMWTEFHQRGNEDCVPDHVAYATALYAWSVSGRSDAPQRAEALFANMKSRVWQQRQRLVSPSEAIYVALMVVWNRSTLPDAPAKAQAYFDELLQSFHAGNEVARPTTRAYNALLESKKRMGDAKAGEAILADMTAQGKAGERCVRPNAASFHAILSTLAKSKQSSAPERAEALVSTMQELHDREQWDCRPSSKSFVLLLTCWAKSGKAKAGQRAESIFRRMEEIHKTGNVSFRPNTFGYAAVMDAWVNCGDRRGPLRVQCLLDDMIARCDAGDHGCRPNAVVFNTALTAWSRSSLPGAPLRAMNVLSVMLERHNANSAEPCPDCFNYSAVISAFAEQGNTEQAEVLLRKALLDSRVNNHSSCYNAVIKAYMKAGDVCGYERAMEILCLMHEDAALGNSGSAPTVVTYTNVLDLLHVLRVDDGYRKGYALLTEMMGRHITPNSSTFLSMFNLLRTAQMDNSEAYVNEAYRLLRIMKRMKIKPNSATIVAFNCCTKC